MFQKMFFTKDRLLLDIYSKSLKDILDITFRHECCQTF